MSATMRYGSQGAQQARERLLATTPLTERHHQLAGVSTAVLEGGMDGPPLVLLHGQGEFWGVWKHVIDDLLRDHRIVVVDLPGHGSSRMVEGRLDAARMRQWVDQLIEVTCVERPVLVGHLLGGAVAARYAVHHSEALLHLVLVDTMGLGWFRPSPSFGIPMMRFVAHPTERSRDRLFRQCFLDFDAVGDSFGDHWDDLRIYVLDQAKSKEHQTALRALMPRIGVPPIPSTDLDRIRVPTTLVHGRYDLQVPLRTAEKAAERHGWPLHVIEDARDDPAAEQPQAFVNALQRALASGRSQSEDRS